MSPVRHSKPSQVGASALGLWLLVAGVAAVLLVWVLFGDETAFGLAVALTGAIFGDRLLCMVAARRARARARRRPQ